MSEQIDRDTTYTAHADTGRIETRSYQESSRQVGCIDERSNIDALLLKACFDLELLHFDQSIGVRPQARIAIIIFHIQVNRRADPDHLAVDEELARLARPFQMSTSSSSSNGMPYLASKILRTAA